MTSRSDDNNRRGAPPTPPLAIPSHPSNLPSSMSSSPTMAQTPFMAVCNSLGGMQGNLNHNLASIQQILKALHTTGCPKNIIEKLHSTQNQLSLLSLSPSQSNPSNNINSLDDFRDKVLFSIGKLYDASTSLTLALSNLTATLEIAPLPQIFANFSPIHGISDMTGMYPQHNQQQPQHDVNQGQFFPGLAQQENLNSSSTEKNGDNSDQDDNIVVDDDDDDNDNDDDNTSTSDSDKFETVDEAFDEEFPEEKKNKEEADKKKLEDKLKKQQIKDQKLNSLNPEGTIVSTSLNKHNNITTTLSTSLSAHGTIRHGPSGHTNGNPNHQRSQGINSQYTSYRNPENDSLIAVNGPSHTNQHSSHQSSHITNHHHHQQQRSRNDHNTVNVLSGGGGIQNLQYSQNGIGGGGGPGGPSGPSGSNNRSFNSSITNHNNNTTNSSDYIPSTQSIPGGQTPGITAIPSTTTSVPGSRNIGQHFLADLTFGPGHQSQPHMMAPPPHDPRRGGGDIGGNTRGNPNNSSRTDGGQPGQNTTLFQPRRTTNSYRGSDQSTDHHHQQQQHSSHYNGQHGTSSHERSLNSQNNMGNMSVLMGQNGQNGSSNIPNTAAAATAATGNHLYSKGPRNGLLPPEIQSLAPIALSTAVSHHNSRDRSSNLIQQHGGSGSGQVGQVIPIVPPPPRPTKGPQIHPVTGQPINTNPNCPENAALRTYNGTLRIHCRPYGSNEPLLRAILGTERVMFVHADDQVITLKQQLYTLLCAHISYPVDCYIIKNFGDELYDTDTFRQHMIFNGCALRLFVDPPGSKTRGKVGISVNPAGTGGNNAMGSMNNNQIGPNGGQMSTINGPVNGMHGNNHIGPNDFLLSNGSTGNGNPSNNSMNFDRNYDSHGTNSRNRDTRSGNGRTHDTHSGNSRTHDTHSGNGRNIDTHSGSSRSRDTRGDTHSGNGRNIDTHSGNSNGRNIDTHGGNSRSTHDSQQQQQQQHHNTGLLGSGSQGMMSGNRNDSRTNSHHSSQSGYQNRPDTNTTLNGLGNSNHTNNNTATQGLIPLKNHNSHRNEHQNQQHLTNHNNATNSHSNSSGSNNGYQNTTSLQLLATSNQNNAGNMINNTQIPSQTPMMGPNGMMTNSFGPNVPNMNHHGYGQGGQYPMNPLSHHSSHHSNNGQNNTQNNNNFWQAPPLPNPLSNHSTHSSNNNINTTNNFGPPGTTNFGQTGSNTSSFGSTSSNTSSFGTNLGTNPSFDFSNAKPFVPLGLLPSDGPGLGSVGSLNTNTTTTAGLLLPTPQETMLMQQYPHHLSNQQQHDCGGSMSSSATPSQKNSQKNLQNFVPHDSLTISSSPTSTNLTMNTTNTNVSSMGTNTTGTTGSNNSKFSSHLGVDKNDQNHQNSTSTTNIKVLTPLSYPFNVINVAVSPQENIMGLKLLLKDQLPFGASLEQLAITTVDAGMVADHVIAANITDKTVKLYLR